MALIFFSVNAPTVTCILSLLPYSGALSARTPTSWCSANLQVPKASRDQFKAHSTADGDCSHEIKRCVLLRRKVMTNLDSLLKRRDITLPTKVHVVKAMVFPVVMYGCESWTIKKTEHQRIDAFELWCWRRLWRIPWTARRYNQSTLKEISPLMFIGRTDAEAETLILWPPDSKN